MPIVHKDLACHIAGLATALIQAAQSHAKGAAIAITGGPDLRATPASSALHALLFLEGLGQEPRSDGDNSKDRRQKLDFLLGVAIRGGQDAFENMPWVARHAMGVAEALGQPYGSFEEMRACAVTATECLRPRNAATTA